MSPFGCANRVRIDTTSVDHFGPPLPYLQSHEIQDGGHGSLASRVTVSVEGLKRYACISRAELDLDFQTPLLVRFVGRQGHFARVLHVAHVSVVKKVMSKGGRGVILSLFSPTRWFFALLTRYAEEWRNKTATELFFYDVHHALQL